MRIFGELSMRHSQQVAETWGIAWRNTFLKRHFWIILYLSFQSNFHVVTFFINIYLELTDELIIFCSSVDMACPISVILFCIFNPECVKKCQIDEPQVTQVISLWARQCWFQDQKSLTQKASNISLCFLILSRNFKALLYLVSVYV